MAVDEMERTALMLLETEGELAAIVYLEEEGEMTTSDAQGLLMAFAM